MDRLESMSVFVEVAQLGSLKAAADRRGLSPSMVGKHLRALEERLGLRLLQRTTRRQKLTEAGELFLQRCRVVLHHFDRAEEDAASLRGGITGLLRITAPTSFGVTRLTPALAAFRLAHPRIEIELLLRDGPVDLIGDGVDLAFRIGPLAETELVARPLEQYYQMIVCASPDYLARRGMPERPEDLIHHDCLGHVRWGLQHAWRFTDGDETIEVPIRYCLRIDHGLALREAAIAGAGIVLQPHALLSADITTGRLRRLLTAYEARGRQLYLVYAKDRAAPAKLRAFVDFALEHFGPR